MEDLETRAARYMFQSHLASFFSLAFRLLYPGVAYQQHWSITVLGEALSRCFKGETQRLIINMPPRSLKSFCASVAFPAWTLARRPEAKILCVAGHRGLADDHHALTRDLMNHPKYRALFPHVRFTETAQKIRLPHGGSRSAFTLTGALTGRGADLIIIDDPQAAHEVGDQAKSAAVRTWYDRNIYQRLDNKEGGVIILVMQRLAHDDLTAHLLDHGGWELLSLPAIATRDEQFPRVFDHQVVRRKGEALNPAREDLAKLREAIPQMGAEAFLAQYQQEPYTPGEGDERLNQLTEDPLLPRPPYRKLGKGLFVPAPASSAPMGDLPEPVLWAPQPGGQETFLRDQSTHELLLHGGRGGGKSDALLVSFFQETGIGFGPSFQGVLFRQEEADLEGIRSRLRWFVLNVFPEARLTYSPHTKLEFPTGEILHLAHLSRPSDYDRFHGQSIPWLGFEELTQWATPDLYLAMLSTSRSSSARIPLLVRSTTNPSGPGSSWVKRRFIDNRADLVQRKHIQLNLAENQIFLKANPKYAETIARAARDSEERKAWLNGDWNLAIGGMFDVFDPAVHVVPDIPFEKIPRSWRFDRSYDHGTANPFSVGWWAESNGEPVKHGGRLYGTKRGDLYRIAEWYGGDLDGAGLCLDAREIAQEILKRERDMGIQFLPGPADSQIYAGDSSSPTNNPGKVMLQLGVRWKTANKAPGSRKAGWQEIRSRLKGAIRGEDGRREHKGLFFFERCAEAIRQLPVIVRDKRDLDEIDAATKDDHLVDEIRYRVMYTPTVVGSRSF